MRDTGAEASAALIGLVETCRDGELGFHAAAAGIEDPMLRQLCESYADQRAGFRRELLEALADLGGAPSAPGLGRENVDGTVRSTEGETETAMLAALARQNAAAESAYRSALGRGLPDHATDTVERQHGQVVDALKHLSLLEQTLAADS